MKVWVTRNGDSKARCDIWYKKPEYKFTMYHGGLLFRSNIEPEFFKADFGFTPRKGSVGQYELTLKEIK